MTDFFTLDNLCQATGGIWLRRPNARTHFTNVTVDSRGDLTNHAFFAIRGDIHDGHDYAPEAAKNGACALLVDHTIDLDPVPVTVAVLRVADTRTALGAFAHSYRKTWQRTQVIAITGTCGKTTTKEIVHTVLSTQLTGTRAVKSFNNDIGVPLTLLGASPEHDYVIVEIGTNAPGEIAGLAAIAEPDVAVITMVGRGHLEGLGSLEGVVNEKLSLLNHVRSGGMMIVNGDQAMLLRESRRFHPVIAFGTSAGLPVRMTEYLADSTSCTFEINGSRRFTLPLVGRHLAMNAVAAVTVADHLGLNGKAVADGLQRCQAAPMRAEVIRCGTVTVVNDAYNANPDSMLASITTFATQYATAAGRVMILGDMRELGHHSGHLHRELADALVQSGALECMRVVGLIGPEMRLCADRLRRRATSGNLFHFDALTDHAINELISTMEIGDIVLLKGSRAMKLERLIPCIEQSFAIAARGDLDTAASCPAVLQQT